MKSLLSSRRDWTLLSLVCFGLALAVISNSCPSEAMRPKQTFAGITGADSISTKGKINGKILLTSTRNRDATSLGLRLWSINPDGSNPTELTNLQVPVPSKSALPPNDRAGKWSPDGTKIAFLSSRDFVDVDHDPTPYTIYVMDANGLNLQRVSLDQLKTLSLVNCTEIHSFEWSPDGTQFVLDAGNLVTGIGGCPATRFSTEIYTVNANGSNLLKLTGDTNPSTSTYFMNTSPTWSSDGSRIAFTSWNQNGDGANTIEVMDADGSNRRQIAHYGYQDRINGLSWSPDGSKILFVGPPRYGTCANYICSELYLINPDGTQLTQLTHYPASYGTYSGPRWSPDGMKILFERQLTDPYTHKLINRYAIFVMDVDGSNQVNISNRKPDPYDWLDAEPDWQPLLAPANEPPPSVLGFSDGIYLATYPSTVQIIVTRTGNLDQSVSCDYQIRHGSITGGLPSGSVTFAPGEASNVIPFFYFSGDVFNISLFNNAGNATFLGGMKDATIIFAPPNYNPIDNSAYFVRQHYRDFLGREPDASGWEFWTNNIGACSSNSACSDPKRVSTSASFFLSIEFEQTGYLIERMYKAAYGDAKGASTWNGAHQMDVPIVRFNEFLEDAHKISEGVVVLQTGWEQKLESNKQAFANEFVQRANFVSAFPTSMSPEQFVEKLNANAGNVLPADECATAVASFGGASDTSNLMARAQALRQVAENQNLFNAEFNRAFVLMQYFGYLRRNPDDMPEATRDYTGYDFWLTKLNQFNGNYLDAEMVRAFVTSIEYRQRFEAP